MERFFYHRTLPLYKPLDLPHTSELMMIISFHLLICQLNMTNSLLCAKLYTPNF